MVRTTHYKTSHSRPKQTYWKANQGLVFTGALLSAPDTHRAASSLLFFLLVGYELSW